MNAHYPARLAVALSLFMVAVQAGAEKPLSSSPPVRSDTNLERAEPPDINLRRTRVSQDPVSGRIEVAPGPGTRVRTLSPREKSMLSRSDEGLEPIVLANGAVAVDLRGRFQSMVTTSFEPGNSRLKTSCSIIDAVPSSDEQTPDVHE